MPERISAVAIESNPCRSGGRLRRPARCGLGVVLVAVLETFSLTKDADAQRRRRRSTPPDTSATSATNGTNGTNAASGTAASPEAEAHFRRGLQLATEHSEMAALVEFRRAYELSRNELIRFNIAAVEIELNQYAEGLASLEAYERSAPPDVVRMRRAQIEALRDRILSRSGIVRVPLEVQGLRVQCEAIAADARIVREGAVARAGIRVPVGRYRVSVSAPGHRSVEREFDVASGSTITLDQPLEALETTVTVRANVDDAEVRVDGRLVGRTPLSPIPVSEGTHRIEVTRAGYTRFEINAFTQGTVSAVAANLLWSRGLTSDEAGRVALEREYPDVECSLDGERVDCGGIDMVPPGRHVFRASGRDWVTQEQRVDLAPGRVTTVPMVLQPRPEARRESQDRQWGQRRSGLILGGLSLGVGALGLLWASGTVRDLTANTVQQTAYFDILLRCTIDNVMVMPNQPLMQNDASLQCVRGRIPPTFPFPLTTPMSAVDAISRFETEQSGLLLQLGFAAALVAGGAIGLVVGTVVFFTAPGERFSTLPARRTQPRIALDIAPNGLSIRF